MKKIISLLLIMAIMTGTFTAKAHENEELRDTIIFERCYAYNIIKAYVSNEVINFDYPDMFGFAIHVSGAGPISPAIGTNGGVDFIPGDGVIARPGGVLISGSGFSNNNIAFGVSGSDLIVPNELFGFFHVNKVTPNVEITISETSPAGWSVLTRDCTRNCCATTLATPDMENALAILRYVVGLPTEIEVTVATHDFDGDGIVEIADALLVLWRIVGFGWW